MLKPNQINHCKLADPNPGREQKYLYAHGIRYRLKNGLATQFEIKAELNQRKDALEIRNILEELANEN